MNFKDLLNESATDIVARLYKESSAKSEKFYNPENVKYKNQNKVYYENFFKDYFKEEITPVFTKPVDKPQKQYTNVPKDGKLQSPGYRGLHYALQAAGLPYDHNVQKYDPPAPAVMSSELNSVRNNL